MRNMIMLKLLNLINQQVQLGTNCATGQNLGRGRSGFILSETIISYEQQSLTSNLQFGPKKIRYPSPWRATPGW
jgi:hypothetical protein